MALYTSPKELEGQPLAPTNTLQRERDATYDLEKSQDDFRSITHRQLFYTLVPHAFGAALIDAVANFAIACVMYRTTRKEIRLWPLEKNTIAGDMGVTVIIQGILTMLITSSLVRGDIRAGRIEPFSFSWPHGAHWQRRATPSKWRCYAARAMHSLSPTQTLSLRTGRREFSKSLFLILLRGFVISVLYFFLVWPFAIAITAPLYGGVDMHGTWTPQIIKAVFGGVLGLLMNPFVAALVLGASVPPPRATAQCKPKIMSTTPIAPPAFAVVPEMRHTAGYAPMSVAEGKNVDGVARPVLAHVSSRT